MKWVGKIALLVSCAMMVIVAHLVAEMVALSVMVGGFACGGIWLMLVYKLEPIKAVCISLCIAAIGMIINSAFLIMFAAGAIMWTMV